MASHHNQPHPDVVAHAVRCAIVTISDTRTPKTDQSGQLMQRLLAAAGHPVTYYEILKDEPAQITALVKQLALSTEVQAILLNGGTGIAPRDTTYDAIAQLLTKTLPGFGEIFRQLSYTEIGSRAIASRAIAGIHTNHSNSEQASSTLIFSVPGSSKAVKLAMEALIIPELSHLAKLLSSG